MKSGSPANTVVESDLNESGCLKGVGDVEKCCLRSVNHGLLVWDIVQ